MYFTLIAEILLALLAVFGLYVLIRILFFSHSIGVAATVAVEIGADLPLEEIPELLDRAADAAFLCGARRMIALVDESRSQEEPLLTALRTYVQEIYFVNI
ncbi:MAG: hypothetical protein IJY50_01760 [Clostridia bacterium]|nr:hypothetical protein [Clostridia bacterium]